MKKLILMVGAIALLDLLTGIPSQLGNAVRPQPQQPVIYVEQLPPCPPDFY